MYYLVGWLCIKHLKDFSLEKFVGLRPYHSLNVIINLILSPNQQMKLLSKNWLHITN